MATSEDSTASPAIWRKPPAQPGAQAVADYDHDFFVWTRQQAEALRAGRLKALDLKNLAEEVESMGNEVLHGIRSRLLRVVEHLLYLQFSPATEPRRHWKKEIRNWRDDIEDRLRDSPSLRPRMDGLLAEQWPRARRNALDDLAIDRVQTLPDACPYTIEEVLEPGWWPPSVHDLS